MTSLHAERGLTSPRRAMGSPSESYWMTPVTLLCDRGSLYMQRLFNPKWLADKGLQPQH